ncbi:MAG: FAD-dependent oxidoreductase [Kiritimatiellia bacterium]
MKPYDVLVCGGGMAGFAASAAAARNGADTLLVEQTEVLGGLGSSGGVGNFCAAKGGLKGQGREFADVLDRLREYRAMGEEHGWPSRGNENLNTENRLFDHQMLPIVLHELTEEAGVDVLFATTVTGAEMHGDIVRSAVLHNRSLRRETAAKVFVDASGDGLLAQYAGASVLPDDPNLPGTIKPSFMIFLRKVPDAQPQPLPAKTRYAEGGENPDYSVWPEPNGRVGLKMKLFEMDFDTGGGDGYNDALIAMRTRIPEAVRHYQEHHDASYVFDFASPMLGIREGRRVEGDCVLSIDDIRNERKFDDAVAYGTFTVDANKTREVLPPYHIPYRCLIAKGIDNCLVAGRCLSADRLAQSSARVMPTGTMMGSAAGTAAALAVKENKPIRDLEPAAIRGALMRDTPDSELIAQRLSA